ncbi:GIN domain-containing protein [Aquimarina sp. AU119]|uniref:GIN domain-containing protein n=1 Tax=Aquimarina sp. AU119 TaxID=2108528 RepID=UPI000D6961A6|nr:DUF2807 domain-containing protein [Aquimarina sp. AU119]
MKYIILTISFLTSIISFSQHKTIQVNKFEAIEHTIAGTIKINKANVNRIEFSGDAKAIKYISVTISDNTLKIISKKSNINFSKVITHIFTPSLAALKLESGGNVTMNSDFSKIENFVVTIKNGGTINLSNIEFNNLIATINSGGIIKYKSADHLTQNIDGGGIIKAVKK